MKSRFFPLVLLFLAFITVGCIFTPLGEVPDWYPSTWTIADSQIDEFDSVYTSFSENFNLNELVFNYTDSLCSHIDYLCSRDIVQMFSPETSNDPVEDFDRNLKSFLDEWWRLVSIEEFKIKEINSSLHENTGRINSRIIPKSTYKYPLNSPDFELGRLQITTDENGYMETIWSNLVPQLPVPDNPNINLIEVKDIVNGYEYRINKWLSMDDVILSKSDIESSELQVLLLRDNDETYIKYLLIWSLRVQDGNIYVDAMTGEILGYQQTTIYG